MKKYLLCLLAATSISTLFCAAGDQVDRRTRLKDTVIESLSNPEKSADGRPSYNPKTLEMAAGFRDLRPKVLEILTEELANPMKGADGRPFYNSKMLKLAIDFPDLRPKVLEIIKEALRNPPKERTFNELCQRDKITP